MRINDPLGQFISFRFDIFIGNNGKAGRHDNVEIGIPSISKQYQRIHNSPNNLNHEKLVDTGFELIKVMKFANVALGKIIFIEMTIASFNFAINAYFICTIFTLFFGKFLVIVFIFILSNILIMVMSVLRIAHLTFLGQGLSQSLERAKDELQQYQVIYFSTFE